MRESSDPEDLQLKMRKMFPNIEVREGEMSPTTSDFAEILELQQFRKLYEEQEEKTKMKLAEKDDELEDLRTAMRQRDDVIEDGRQRYAESLKEQERLKGDYGRLRQEAQEKIDKLMERIKELNQKLVGNAR
jgi:chromosome segregation ATPase